MAKKKKKPEEDISIDIGSVKKFFTGLNIDKNRLLLIALILIPLLLAIHFRVDSAYLPVTEDWATSAVYNQIRNNIANEVNARYPNLPAQNKQELVEQQLQKVLVDQKTTINQQVVGTAQHFKSRLQNDDGQTYLLAIDPYQWYRRTENWVQDGHWSDEFRDGKPWNTHMYAPLGVPMGPSLHVTFAYHIYKVVHFFNSDLPLLTIFFYLPVLFASLAVIPAFFIARRKAGNFGGFVAATLLAVHTHFLGRTAAGFSDTDPYNVFFPLVIAWLFIECFETDNTKSKIALGIAAGLITGIFAGTWAGWWYIFDFLLGVLLAYFGYLLIKEFLKHKNLKKIFTAKPVVNTIITGALFLVSSGLFVMLFKSFEIFTRAFTEPIGFRIIKNAAHASLWPNVFTTVAELGATSISTIVGSTGGKLMFFLAALGVILTMVSRKMTKRDLVVVCAGAVVYLLLITDKMLAVNPITYLIVLGIPLAIGILLTLKDKRDVDIKYALFLTFWFIGTIYASTKGIRFILLLVPAFAIALGISMGIIQRLVSDWIKSEMKVKKMWVVPIVSILLLFLLVSPIKSAANAGRGEVPSMNDAWWQSLSEIREQATPDAIINSWWDFGHWFKAVADRGVTFDGASQNTPMAHWIGKTLLSSDEKVSLGILRMLDCGSNTAFETINEELDDTVQTVRILNEIIVLDKPDARKVLESKVTNVDEVLELTHCEPPENYFITSQDMVGKAGVWAHFGSWDFERAHIYTNLRNEDPQVAIDYMMNNFGYDENVARTMYYDALALQNEDQANAWISPWPSYITGSWISCSEALNGSVVNCIIGARISQQNGQDAVLEQIIVEKENPKNITVVFGAYDSSTQTRLGGNTAVPESVLMAGETMERYRMDNVTFSYTVLMDTVNTRVLIMHPLFAESLFTKLFYLNGRYTDNFDMFSDKQAVNGQRIIVWKVDWDGKES